MPKNEDYILIEYVLKEQNLIFYKVLHEYEPKDRCGDKNHPINIELNKLEKINRYYYLLKCRKISKIDKITMREYLQSIKNSWNKD